MLAGDGLDFGKREELLALLGFESRTDQVVLTEISRSFKNSINSEICLVSETQLLPNRFLHRMRSSASSVKWPVKSKGKVILLQARCGPEGG